MEVHLYRIIAAAVYLLTMKATVTSVLKKLTLLHEDEAKALERALSLKKIVADILTKLGRIYTINSSNIFNKKHICTYALQTFPG